MLHKSCPAVEVSNSQSINVQGRRYWQMTWFGLPDAVTRLTAVPRWATYGASSVVLPYICTSVATQTSAVGFRLLYAADHDQAAAETDLRSHEGGQPCIGDAVSSRRLHLPDAI
jgi:hypothetical protein